MSGPGYLLSVTSDAFTRNMLLAFATLGFGPSVAVTLSYSILFLAGLGFGWSAFPPSHMINLITCLWGGRIVPVALVFTYRRPDTLDS